MSAWEGLKPGETRPIDPAVCAWCGKPKVEMRLIKHGSVTAGIPLCEDHKWWRG